MCSTCGADLFLVTRAPRKGVAGDVEFDHHADASHTGVLHHVLEVGLLSIPHIAPPDGVSGHSRRAAVRRDGQHVCLVRKARVQLRVRLVEVGNLHDELAQHRTSIVVSLREGNVQTDSLVLVALHCRVKGGASGTGCRRNRKVVGTFVVPVLIYASFGKGHGIGGAWATADSWRSAAISSSEL